MSFAQGWVQIASFSEADAGYCLIGTRPSFCFKLQLVAEIGNNY